MDCLECDCLLSATERGAHVLQSIGPIHLALLCKAFDAIGGQNSTFPIDYTCGPYHSAALCGINVQC